MLPMFNIAIRVARQAGSFIRKYYELNNNDTNQLYIISNMIKKIEELIIDTIYHYYPTHNILFEKKNSALMLKKSDIEWIITPIDGLTNFIKKIPHFAIVISIRIKNRTEIAVIYDCMRNELFISVRGQGTKLNGYRLRGSHPRDFNNMIIATDFFCPFNKKQTDDYIELFKKNFFQCAGIRCSGSIGLDLAYVAAGRLDGFFKISTNKYWNLAAGELLIREAGGLLTDLNGSSDYSNYINIVTGSSPHILKILLSLLRKAVK
ncbi:MAG: inositol monophosphatase family protein [Candidatus Dasytiphilus stammeri]